MQTQNIYKKLKEDHYLLLDSQPFEVESLDRLKKTFHGYNKVIATLLLHYLQLPNWPTLLVYNHTDEKVKHSINAFSKRADIFFVRTDTQFNTIDNIAFRDCSAGDLYNNIEKAKEYKDRWVLILAQPRVLGQAYLNDANFRMGRINGQLTIEWTGPGFSEYHLGKDKFPHQSALHAVQIISADGSVNKIFQADKLTLEKDHESWL